MSESAGERLANVGLDLGELGKTILDAARVARIGVTVTLVEPAGARNVYVSEAAAEILGHSVEDLLARDPLVHISAEDRAHARDRLERRTQGEQGQSHYELEIVRGDGRRVPIEVTASHAMIDGRRAVFAFIVDSSARKAEERDRLRSEARFRELIESAPEPIGIIRNGHFVYANPAYVRVLGFEDAQQLYRVSQDSLLDAGEAAVRAKREARILDGERPPPQTYRVRRPDGSTVLLEVSSVPFEYEARASVLSVARDMTARKALEAQLVQADRLAALGTMAAGVAHEINNPLAYVMLNLEWLSRKLPDAARDPSNAPGLMDVLEQARQGMQRVAAIVSELRSFSRADGETRQLVDLAAVVRSAVRMAGHEIRHRARVVTTFEPARSVWANEARIEQVVINLLLNAAQAMPESRADRNEIRVNVRADGNRRSLLEVWDNGDGIPSEVLPRIFDPFFTTKPAGVGTGLGLSICHGIVTSLGGQIMAYSEPGEGTTFRVTLPATDLADSDAPSPRDDRRSAGGPRARVLVVDDEPPIANALRELLSAEHDVVATTSATEALAAVHAQAPFDVVFCDLMMPAMGGIELYERLRTECPGLERRVVFMTGGAFTTRAAAFLASVENRRIEKPFSFELVERIARDMAGAARTRSTTR